jgi:hypothetical protein
VKGFLEIEDPRVGTGQRFQGSIWIFSLTAFTFHPPFWIPYMSICVDIIDIHPGCKNYFKQLTTKIRYLEAFISEISRAVLLKLEDLEH